MHYGLENLKTYKSEQKIPEIEQTTIKRKLSFSNSDLNDPKQLNYLYSECREQVLTGTHPVSRDTAIKLAAVQCFIDYGPHRSGIENSISAHILLPKEHARGKEHEKNIIQEYKEILCENSHQAKRKYCELCTSLPTYGVTFFLVKERQSANEKRLTRRLFGVNKDCVMSVDRKTKTVLKSWPLEQIRRWAASPTTFNIDFGDYSDGYYSAQTTEGEVIKKLIAEYIDIILIRSRNIDSKGIEGDEGAIMLEDNVTSGRALPFVVEPFIVSQRFGSAFQPPLLPTNVNPLKNNTDNLPPHEPPFVNVNRPEQNKVPSLPESTESTTTGRRTVITGHQIDSEGRRNLQQEGFSKIQDVGQVSSNTSISNFQTPQLQSIIYQPQQSLMSSNSSNDESSVVDATIQYIEQIQITITQKSYKEQIELPAHIRNDSAQMAWVIQVGKQSVREKLIVIVAISAKLLDHTSNFSTPTNNSDYINLVQQIAPTLSDLNDCVRELNSILLLFQESSEDIKCTLNKLCDVLILYLDNLHPDSGSKRSIQLSAASLIGEVGCSMLTALEGGYLLKANNDTAQQQQMFYDLLNDRIQNIATSTTNLVLQAKTISDNGVTLLVVHKKLIQSATRVALTASELVGLSRCLLPIIVLDPECKPQIGATTQLLVKSIDEMVVDAGNAARSSSSNAAQDQKHKFEQLCSSAHFANNTLLQFMKQINI